MYCIKQYMMLSSRFNTHTHTQTLTHTHKHTHSHKHTPTPTHSHTHTRAPSYGIHMKRTARPADRHRQTVGRSDLLEFSSSRQVTITVVVCRSLFTRRVHPNGIFHSSLTHEAPKNFIQRSSPSTSLTCLTSRMLIMVPFLSLYLIMFKTLSIYIGYGS